MGADELLELADELEEQGRALLRHARQLQRLAERSGGGSRPARAVGGGPRPERPERGGGGTSGGGARRGFRERGEQPERGERPRGAGRKEESGGSGDRPPKRSSSAPDWAPTGRKRRS
jgi:hypothetical protein